MSGTTNFELWSGTSPFNNAESDAAYAADAQRANGAVNGPFDPTLANKFFGQESIFTNAMVQMLVGKNYSPNDGSASPSTALAALTTVLNNILTNADRPLYTGGAATLSTNPSMTFSLTAPIPLALFNGILRLSAGVHCPSALSGAVTAEVLIGTSVIATYSLKNSGDFAKFAIDVAITFGTNTLNCYAIASGISIGAAVTTPNLTLNAYSGTLTTGTPFTFRLASAASANVYMDYFTLEVV